MYFLTLLKFHAMNYFIIVLVSILAFASCDSYKSTVNDSMANASENDTLAIKKR